MQSRNKDGRTPDLKKLSVAILEHLVEPVIGKSAIQEIKSPLNKKALKGKLSKALNQAETKFLERCDDKEISNLLINLPLSNLPSVNKAVVDFCENPDDVELLKELERQFPKNSRFNKKQIDNALNSYLLILKQEIASISKDIGSTMQTQSMIRLEYSLRNIDRFNSKAKSVPKPISNHRTIKKDQDKVSLQNLFAYLNLDALDIFFLEDAPDARMTDEVLAYWIDFNWAVSSSTFYLHDRVLNKLLNGFCASWNKSMSFGRYFINRFGNKIYYFQIQDEDSRSAYIKFYKFVLEMDRNLAKLIAYIHNKYPEFDFKRTSNAARKRHISISKQIDKLFD